MTGTSKFDMTKGSIFTKLLTISGPIIGSQIVQMTYNLTDMFWLGRLGSDAVAASGTVGMYLWLSMAFSSFGGKGAEIGVSQSLGRGDRERATQYGQAAVMVSLGMGVLFAAVLMGFRGPLIAFFNIREQAVVQASELYQLLVSLGVPFNFLAIAFTGIFNASGNSRIPFFINAFSLLVNMVLDPVLIFSAGLGVAGAAVATSVAQVVACVLLGVALKRYELLPFREERLFALPGKAQLAQIFRWSTPIAIESFLFTGLTMLISRMVAAYGAGAIAAQRVASQIESLSWLIAGGYSIALTAFVGQNFGAGRYGRIRSCFKISSGIMTVYGILITVFLLFGGGAVFSIFLPGDSAALAIGVSYLRILAICQLPACYEAVAAGMFRGTGKTLPPSLVSVVCNAGRVLLAWALAKTALGLDGIWWGVSIGCGLRGLWMFFWYIVHARKLPKGGVSAAGTTAALE